VHAGDALDTDWRALTGGVSGPVTIAANLPYGIASLLLAGWLETEPWPPWYARMVLMFQREVAERIVASPGSKAYGRLSVLAQWRTEPHIVMHLPAEAFTPPVSARQSVSRASPACTSSWPG
jgi:16S rRNA (adenine1518-N6/adenine1519-N6)-dimethyltransferase